MAEGPRGRGRQETTAELPHLLPTRRGHAAKGALTVRRAENPIPNGTLGAIGLGARITGPDHFDETILVQPFDRRSVMGTDVSSVRGFRWDPRTKTLNVIWNSGVNVALGYVWTRIRRPGIYVALGLPRDRLLQEILRTLALERRLLDSDLEKDHRALTQRALKPLLEIPLEALQELRGYLARIEIQTSAEGLAHMDVEMGMGGHPLGYVLPGGLSLESLRKRLAALEVPPGGLPEEQLFAPPFVPRNGEPPWNIPPQAPPWNGADWHILDRLDIWKYPWGRDHLPHWLFSQDWWMYQHDVNHTGHASGLSDIQAATVGGLRLLATVPVDGPVITKPSIVDGKIYVGSGKSGGAGGTLYKIDLNTGTVDLSTPTSGSAFYAWVSGIGGSPAVVGDRVYFTGVHGTVYCVDANTFAPVWSVSLKNSDLAHNQPVDNPSADSWSGPLVVNGKVYVGCGEGESPTTYGFVYCLDASTGNVIWCFCTCKFTGGADNQPNHIPAGIAASWAAAHGFTVQADPPETGCSVWSSCAYDSVNDCIYVGTGNSEYPHTSQPDELYGSGLISLDAGTGAFRGFFQPAADDSYWPGDSDIDVPGSPTVYSIGAQRVVAFGSKNGSFFVLDAGNVTSVVARRQLLPRVGGTGLPGNRGTGIASVVPTGGAGENSYGVLATPAIHGGLQRIFVGIGGYNGMALDAAAGIDQTRTPFLRALNWNDLHDAWPTTTGADGVDRYTNTQPPMYSSLEVGLSSPAVVHDVVFVSTSPPPYGSSKPGLYALSVNDGHCLWSAGGLPTGGFALGPTVYGNFVVVGAGNNVYIYKLGPRFPVRVPDLYRRPWPWEIVEKFIPVTLDPHIGPRPGPDPLPFRGKTRRVTRVRAKAARKKTRRRR